jgi:hypothetical protein
MLLLRRILTYYLFTNEVINIVAKHEVYAFLNGFLKYHQISIAPKN